MKSKTFLNRGLLFTGSFLLLALATTTESFAQVDSWAPTGGSSDFNTASNWSLGVVPGTGNSDSIDFSTNTQGTYAVNLSATNATGLTGGATLLDFDANAPAYMINSANGSTLVIDTQNALNVPGLENLSANAQTINSNLTLQNSMLNGIGANLQISLNSNLTINGTLNLNVPISSAGTGTGNLNIEGALIFNSLVDAGGTGTTYANFNWNGAGQVFLNPTSFTNNEGSSGNIRSSSGGAINFQTSINLGAGFFTVGSTSSSIGLFKLLNDGVTLTSTNARGFVIGPTTGGHGTYVIDSAVSGGGSTALAGSVYITNGTTAGSPFNAVLASSANNTMTVSGVISDQATTSSSTIQAPLIFGNSGTFATAATGAVVLTQANTYTSGTAINSGTLLVTNTTGSATGTGGVMVGNGATAAALGGTGIVTGAVTIANAASALSPGIYSGIHGMTPATGTLTLNGGLAATSGLTLNLAISGASPTGLLALGSGAASFGGTLTLNLVDVGSGTFQANTLYTIMSGTGTWTGTPAVVLGTDPTGYSGFSYVYTPTTGADSLQIEFTAVPEPGTWALLISGLVLLGFFYRRREGRVFAD
jgi:fibronectin-binding autotransporter adhesin